MPVSESSSARVRSSRSRARTPCAPSGSNRVALENIDALAEAGLFRLTRPRSVGGYEAPVVTQIEALAEIATSGRSPCMGSPKTNLELYGRVLCGLEPNTMML